MAYTAANFVQRFMDLTLDPTNVRWPATEVIRYANDGQRDIALHRPDAFTTSALFPCVAGSKQTLPSGAVKLIKIDRNGATGRAVTPIKRELLDQSIPLWHNATASTTVLHSMYDERDPLTFWVYPPAVVTTTTLQMVYASVPTDIPTPSSELLAGVSGSLSVADIHVNALLDYVLYRAYSKDSEYAGNQQRARDAFTSYAMAMELDLKRTLAFSPNANSPLNPLVPGRQATAPASN